MVALLRIDGTSRWPVVKLKTSTIHRFWLVEDQLRSNVSEAAKAYVCQRGGVRSISGTLVWMSEVTL